MKKIEDREPALRESRDHADVADVRSALMTRHQILQDEYDRLTAEINDVQRDSFMNSAGDDQADIGTKTFEREQGISLARGIRGRIDQVDRALERLDDGNYGWCERCGNQIPIERLTAFPSATLCVTCKQMEERR